MNLEGAPYGYTPFCDSRREMEGYRFWKTGYWASHLGHRKYHIRYTSMHNCEMAYSSTDCSVCPARTSDILLTQAQIAIVHPRLFFTFTNVQQYNPLPSPLTPTVVIFSQKMKVTRFFSQGAWQNKSIYFKILTFETFCC